MIYWQYEKNWLNFGRENFLSRRAQQAADEYMRATVKDTSLHPILTPDYRIGGKRILFSDDYFDSLNRDNVRIVLGGVDRFTDNAIVTKDGQTFAADVVVYATGFQSTAFLSPMAIEGRGGRKLNDEWKTGAQAYLGLTVSGYPNLFLMYGPNTNLGHNSIIFMIECQTTYILDCIRKMAAEGIDAIDVRRDVMDAYNDKVQRELARSVWAATGKSWYKTEAGRITNNWSGSTVRYWLTTRHADIVNFEKISRSRDDRKAEVVQIDSRRSSAA
jgi:cation diffusion facilitator CzcD-associated flavoprotein CzcO